MAQSCDRIVRGLRRRGVLVDVLHFVPSARGGRPWVIEEQAAGRYLACPVEDDPAHALNRAWSALQARPVDYTHVVAFGGSRPIMAGPVLAAWLGVPLITLIRGNDFDAAVFSTRRRPILDDALRASALVVANSRSKVERIAAMHPRTRTRWVPNGIEPEWALAPSDRAQASAFRATHDRLTLGLFGQLKAKKGGVFLLDALVRSGVADRFHLLLAGWMAPDMEAWLAEHELAHTTLPFLDRFELLPWYAACDWLAIPSFYDGLPNVLTEAAALGVPMIAARAASLGASSQSERSMPFGIQRTSARGCSAAILSTLSLETAQTSSLAAKAWSRIGRRRVEKTAASKSLPRIRVISGTPSQAANTGPAMIGREPPNATTWV
jgi:glycosyltransferase involved in cell wall biosynthesis